MSGSSVSSSDIVSSGSSAASVGGACSGGVTGSSSGVPGGRNWAARAMTVAANSKTTSSETLAELTRTTGMPKVLTGVSAGP